MTTLEIQLTDSMRETLEIGILAIAVLAIIALIYLSVRYRRIIKTLKKTYAEDQKIFEKRMEIYDRMGPKLNDLFCFYCYNGNWKEITPVDTLRLKKELDKDMQVHAPLFSEETSQKYQSFVQLCFVAHSGWEHEEKIKSLYDLRKDNMDTWTDEWIPYFDTNNVVDAIRMKERYDALVESFGRDLNPKGS